MMSSPNTPTTSETAETELTDEIKERVLKCLQSNRYAGALGLSKWTQISQDVVQEALGQLIEEGRVIEGGLGIDETTPSTQALKKSPGTGRIADERIINPNGVYYPTDQAA